MSSAQPVEARRRTVTAPDGADIPVLDWRGEAKPKAVVHVLHGLAEHPARYRRPAERLVRAGYAVSAHAHRGHGERGGGGAAVHFGPGGWDAVIDDVRAVGAGLAEEFPERPRVMLGHSMGSYIAQSFVLRQPGALDALALSGSTSPKRAEVGVGRLLARLIAFLRGEAHVSPLLQKLSFGAFNKRFEPARTEFDWLSRDAAEVDRYVADPLCGQPATASLWAELLGGLLEISRPGALEQVPATLPVLIFGGAHDPAGGERALGALAGAWRASGHDDVTLAVYPEGRHEMLNEINRDEVTEDLIRWLDRVTPDS